MKIKRHRNTSRLAGVAIALVALLMAPTASALPITTLRQWSFGTRTLMTGTQYQLRNLVNNKSLGYRAGSTSPQLQWASNGTWELLPHNANHTVRDHRKRPVVSGGQYWLVNSAARRYFAPGAASSGWRTLPVAWTVEIEPSTGAVSLRSSWVGDYLIYNPHKSGFTIGWLSNLTHTASVPMQAQQVTQGFVPFLGAFGGGVNFSAILIDVRNPPNGPWLSFVKPGFSTTQCGNPNAIIRLGPGQVMTPAQMRTLWGSTTPSLRQRLPFLTCAATNGSIVWVNIKYQDV